MLCRVLEPILLALFGMSFVVQALLRPTLAKAIKVQSIATVVCGYKSSPTPTETGSFGY
jgi:hypothetical protein